MQWRTNFWYDVPVARRPPTNNFLSSWWCAGIMIWLIVFLETWRPRSNSASSSTSASALGCFGSSDVGLVDLGSDLGSMPPWGFATLTRTGDWIVAIFLGETGNHWWVARWVRNWDTIPVDLWEGEGMLQATETKPHEEKISTVNKDDVTLAIQS